MPRGAGARLRRSTRHLYFRHDEPALAREDSAAYQHSKSASFGRSSLPRISTLPWRLSRGQITQDEAEKLIRQAEDAHGRQARSAGGGGAGTKAGADRSQPKAERPSREVAREETKPAASAAKRASGATAAAKPEKKQPAK